MGILIQFPQPGTRTPSREPSSGENEPPGARLAAAYQRDLDRAVSLLLEHIQNDAYDGVALILKPKSKAHKPAFVVGGLYRHKLTEAADAAMHLHLSIKLRAREQDSALHPRNSRDSSRLPQDHQEGALNKRMQQDTLQTKWNNATARYHRCEHMLRIAFSKQLRASPETTSILLSITQLHIETIANCLWELVRQPGRATPQTKRETLNAIQLFRNLRAQVSAWMPPIGQESAYFSANASALTEQMLSDTDPLLREVESCLSLIACTEPEQSVGT